MAKVEVDLKLLIAAIALIIIAIVATSFTTYLMFSGVEPKNAIPEGEDLVEKNRDIGPTYHIGEFTVNLTANISSRFIRTDIVVEVSERATINEIETRKYQIRDRIITILRAKTVDQLNNPDQLELLRFEIMQNVNHLLNSGEIVDLFFIDLVIQ